MTKQNDVTFEIGSTNIFDDLGLANAEELQSRALIGCHVVQLLHLKKMKQLELAEFLGVKQAEVSHLMRGNFNRFTTDKLLSFLRRMEQKVTIQISPHRQGEPYQHVAFGA